MVRVAQDEAMNAKAARAPTPEQIEGPYWLPGSPARTNLLASDVVGKPIKLAGKVLLHAFKPVEGAWVDFWQCDGQGVYDCDGYRLRGHRLTDAEGRYQLQ